MTTEQFKVIVRAFLPNDEFVSDCEYELTNWYHDGHLVGVFSPQEQFWDVQYCCTSQEQMATYINHVVMHNG